MNLPDIGEVITPIDDPCQFNPAWRSILAGYLFSFGRFTDDDVESISNTGCVTVTRTVTHKAGKKGKSKAKEKKSHRDIEKAIRAIPPFDKEPQYRVLATDRWIRDQMRMLDSIADGNPPSEDDAHLRLASRWYSEIDHEAAMKKRLEPLLLTDIGIDIITLDLIGIPSAQPAVEAYEKMYFNCRDENFNLNPSRQLIERFAMPWGPLKMFLRKWEDLDGDGFCIQDGRPIAKDSDVWRAVAATMGYEVLMYVWRWEGKAHGIKDNSLSRMIEMSWKASVGRLLSDLYTGNIAHEDVARILASYTSQMKFMSDDRKEGGEGEDTTMAMLSLLYAAAPKMRQLVEGGEGMITDNDIRNRIAAQQAIDKQNIQDAGKQVADEVIEAQIADAIER